MADVWTNEITRTMSTVHVKNGRIVAYNSSYCFGWFKDNLKKYQEVMLWIITKQLFKQTCWTLKNLDFLTWCYWRQHYLIVLLRRKRKKTQPPVAQWTSYWLLPMTRKYVEPDNILKEKPCELGHATRIIHIWRNFWWFIVFSNHAVTYNNTRNNYFQWTLEWHKEETRRKA